MLIYCHPVPQTSNSNTLNIFILYSHPSTDTSRPTSAIGSTYLCPPNPTSCQGHCRSPIPPGCCAPAAFAPTVADCCGLSSNLLLLFSYFYSSLVLTLQLLDQPFITLHHETPSFLHDFRLLTFCFYHSDFAYFGRFQ